MIRRLESVQICLEPSPWNGRQGQCLRLVTTVSLNGVRHNIEQFLAQDDVTGRLEQLLEAAKGRLLATLRDQPFEDLPCPNGPSRKGPARSPKLSPT